MPIAVLAALILSGCAQAGGNQPSSVPTASTTALPPAAREPSPTPPPSPTATPAPWTNLPPPSPTAGAAPPAATPTPIRVAATATALPPATPTAMPSPTAAPAAPPSAAPAGASGPTGQLTQRNSGGQVTIDVTWKSPTSSPAELTYSVVMDTHSKDLDGYDLGELSVLRNDRGQQVAAQSWDSPPGGHHRSGTLVFPAVDGAGKALVEGGVRYVEMVIRDVAGVNERVLRWDISG